MLDALTCVVGKNQAGKSALLRALHKFNPHLPDPYDMRSEWPRGQRTQRNNKQAVCEVRFTLSPEEVKKLAEITGQEVSDENVVVTKDYEGNYEIEFPEDSTLFPSVVASNFDRWYLPKPARADRTGRRETSGRWQPSAS